MDTLFKDMKQVMYNSSSEVLKKMFPDGVDNGDVSKRPTTTGTAFKTSLNQLITNLMAKNPHYGKCVMK